MRAVVSITRRVRVAGVDAEDTALHAELFNTFVNYGVIEEVLFEEDRDFHSGVAIIQFQRISAAERLQSDVESSGRRWSISYLPPVTHVGEKLLVTSSSSFDIDFLRSLIPHGAENVTIEEKILQVPHTLSSEAAGVAAMGVTSPGFCGNVGSRGGAKLKLSSSRNEGVIRMFLQALSCVKARAIGKYVAVMTFEDAHGANTYLANNQGTLAINRGVYVTHVGTSDDLIHALADVLLTRWMLKEVKVGLLLRGVVLPQSFDGGSGNSVTSCDVDVGLTRKGRTIIVRAKTNFMKVMPWDFVEVKLTSLDSAQEGGLVGAELCGTVSGVGGGQCSLNSHPVLASCSPRARSSQPLVGGPSCGSSSSKGMVSVSSKELAGRLYKVLQGRRTASEGAENSLQQQRSCPSTAERVHAFPPGLRTLSAISVCILSVGDDGLHARTVVPPHVTPSPEVVTSHVEWPVFIPSAFVPGEGGVSWRDFAIPGERMSVALLYATSIGGSEAALRLVASKRDSEVRRASSAHMATQGKEEECRQGGRQSSSSTLLPGTSFSGTRVVWLPSTPSTDNPVYVVLPASTSPSQLFSLVIFMRDTTPTAGAAHAVVADAVMSSLVVSEVVHDAHRGYYAVAVEEHVYRQQQERCRVVQSQVASEQEQRIQRILAETLAGCASGHASPVEMAIGGRGQKRQRSPTV